VVQTLETQLRLTPILPRARVFGSMRSVGAALSCAGFALGSAAGCAEMSDAPARLSQLRIEIAELVRAGADACAPRELALARAHADFAAIELRQGHRQRLSQHLREAQDNAAAAQARNGDAHCAQAGRLLPTAADSQQRSDDLGGLRARLGEPAPRRMRLALDADGCGAFASALPDACADRREHAAPLAADGCGGSQPAASLETPAPPRPCPGPIDADSKLGFARKASIPRAGACDDRACRVVFATRLTTHVYGDRRPIEWNSMSGDRAINRRVELVRSDRAQ
jgi:hypothetical protein